MSENKTIAEVYEEVIKNPELQKEFLEAQKNGTIDEFSAKHGCKATAEEVEAFLKEKLEENKEMPVDDLDQVAGGKPDRPQEVKTYSCTCKKCGATFEIKSSAAYIIAIHNNLISESNCDGSVSLTCV